MLRRLRPACAAPGRSKSDSVAATSLFEHLFTAPTAADAAALISVTQQGLVRHAPTTGPLSALGEQFGDRGHKTLRPAPMLPLLSVVCQSQHFTVPAAMTALDLLARSGDWQKAIAVALAATLHHHDAEGFRRLVKHVPASEQGPLLGQAFFTDLTKSLAPPKVKAPLNQERRDQLIVIAADAALRLGASKEAEDRYLSAVDRLIAGHSWEAVADIVHAAHAITTGRASDHTDTESAHLVQVTAEAAGAAAKAMYQDSDAIWVRALRAVTHNAEVSKRAFVVRVLAVGTTVGEGRRALAANASVGHGLRLLLVQLQMCTPRRDRHSVFDRRDLLSVSTNARHRDMHSTRADLQSLCQSNGTERRPTAAPPGSVDRAVLTLEQVLPHAVVLLNDALRRRSFGDNPDLSATKAVVRATWIPPHPDTRDHLLHEIAVALADATSARTAMPEPMSDVTLSHLTEAIDATFRIVARHPTADYHAATCAALCRALDTAELEPPVGATQAALRVLPGARRVSIGGSQEDYPVLMAPPVQHPLGRAFDAAPAMQLGERWQLALRVARAAQGAGTLKPAHLDNFLLGLRRQQPGHGMWEAALAGTTFFTEHLHNDLHPSAASTLCLFVSPYQWQTAFAALKYVREPSSILSHQLVFMASRTSWDLTMRTFVYCDGIPGHGKGIYQDTHKRQKPGPKTRLETAAMAYFPSVLAMDAAARAGMWAGAATILETLRQRPDVTCAVNGPTLRNLFTGLGAAQRPVAPFAQEYHATLPQSRPASSSDPRRPDHVAAGAERLVRDLDARGDITVADARAYTVYLAAARGDVVRTYWVLVAAVRQDNTGTHLLRDVFQVASHAKRVDDTHRTAMCTLLVAAVAVSQQVVASGAKRSGFDPARYSTLTTADLKTMTLRQVTYGPLRGALYDAVADCQDPSGYRRLNSSVVMSLSEVVNANAPFGVLLASEKPPAKTPADDFLVESSDE